VRRSLFAFLVFLSASLNCFLAQVKSAPSPASGEPSASRPQSSSTGSEKLKRPNGVLLGTHWPVDSSEKQSWERTWWIAEIGGEIQIREIPNLLIPRKDGFWVAGTKQIEEQCSYIWTAPLGTLPKNYDPNTSDSGCHDEQLARDILFVGTNHLAIGESQGGLAIVYDGARYYVSTIEQPNRNSSENKSIQVSDVLGLEGTRAFNKAVDATGDGKAENFECGKMKASPANWAIRRKKGRWLLEGSGSRSGRDCDGYFGTEFAIKMQPPKSLIGYDELSVGWTKIEKSFRDAKDALESPNQDFAITIVGQQLVVCRLANGEIGAVVARHPLHENEYVVMAQWALGDNVARWDKQVREFKEPKAK
jgi:hypothetical protein